MHPRSRPSRSCLDRLNAVCIWQDRKLLREHSTVTIRPHTCHGVCKNLDRNAENEAWQLLAPNMSWSTDLHLTILYKQERSLLLWEELQNSKLLNQSAGKCILPQSLHGTIANHFLGLPKSLLHAVSTHLVRTRLSKIAARLTLHIFQDFLKPNGDHLLLS